MLDVPCAMLPNGPVCMNAGTPSVYGARGVEFSDQASRDIRQIEKLGYSNLYICMAKTQYSLSDNPKLISVVYVIVYESR